MQHVGTMRPLRALLVLASVVAFGASEPALPELHPAGAPRILEEVRRPGASAVLVNVWATWCQPCREEFPDLVRVRKDLAAKGLRVVFVSGDFPEAEKDARRFLAEHGVNTPTFIKDGDDMAFIDGLDPRWSGALPATFLYDGTGALRDYWVGKSTYRELVKKVNAVLGGSPKTPNGKETR